MIFNSIASGKSVEGTTIEAFKTDNNSKKYLYLIAGTHGDEVEGVYMLKELFTWLKTDHSLKELPVVVIPLLNPDGYRAQTRVNSQGVDLNRNYPTSDWESSDKMDRYYPGPEPLSEPENKYLKKLFDKYPPGFIISFHTWWKAIINYNGNAEQESLFLGKYNNYEASPTMGYPTPGSLGTYVTEKYNADIITFECPPLSIETRLRDIWDENEEGLKTLLQDELILKRFVK